MRSLHGIVWMMLIALLALGLSGCYVASGQTLGTPMPTHVPGTPVQFVALEPPHRVSDPAQPTPMAPCRVKAVDLIGAWVTAGAPETDPFPFTDLKGETCQGNFGADIQPLFTRSNLWYDGAPSCVACHHADLAGSWANLDLSSYTGIVGGSRRMTAEAKGANILGMTAEGADWSKAILLVQFNTLRMPPGHPANADPKGPVVSAGHK
jgi:hypothetical protein